MPCKLGDSIKLITLRRFQINLVPFFNENRYIVDSNAMYICSFTKSTLISPRLFAFCFSYLRVIFIFSRYSSSHACILMARIPETTWFIKEMRRPEAAAVRRRSAAVAKDNPAKYGKRKHRKMPPMRVCQPIK